MADTMILSPVLCMYPDDDYENLIVEVVLPGVEMKDISFKLTEDSFYVAANKAVAKYTNGVLKVTVPYQKPLGRLVDVKIE